MYCPLVFININLKWKLFSTLPARVFYSFMYSPLVFSQVSFCSCLILTIFARIFDSFMYCPLVFIKMSLYRKFFAAMLQAYFIPSWENIFVVLLLLICWRRNGISIKENWNSGVKYHHIKLDYIPRDSFCHIIILRLL